MDALSEAHERRQRAVSFIETLETAKPHDLPLSPEETELAAMRLEALAQAIAEGADRWTKRQPRFIGVMRIKNEARWIGRVIASQIPLVEKLFIFDDHSTDKTRQICQKFTKVELFESPFEGLDESRDKQWILDRAIEAIPRDEINETSRWWVLALDGDEILEDWQALPEIAASEKSNVYSVRILYLWESEDQVRVDGVYGKFYRPSLFRLINPAFKYQSTPFGDGANFHCSSIPQEYLGQAAPCSARVLHLGYMHQEDRLKKYAWYTGIDPNNPGEDNYAHMVMGDLPQFPAEQKRMHAGPLKLEPLG